MICTLSYWVVWALALADDSASASQSAAARGSFYLLLTACLQLSLDGLCDVIA